MTAIDLFAGLGGWTEGARQAGVRVLWAANHWRAAVDWHSRNHPEVTHACQDLRQADWAAAPRPDVALCSPSCKGFTRARGKDRPHHDNERATAWAVVDFAEYHRPQALLVENVEEFLQWTLYPAWRTALEALGYALAPHVFDAADMGVPQHRVRVVIVCTRSRHPLQLALPQLEHVNAASILEKTPCTSPVRHLCLNTRRRVSRGRHDLGVQRFLFPYYSNGSGLTGRSLDRPLGTVTTCDRWALVDGTKMRMLSLAEYRRAMGFPENYQMPGNKRLGIHLLGNAVPPPAAACFLRALKAAA